MNDAQCLVSYSSQSTAMMRETSSTGRLAAVRTMTRVNKPAMGTLVAPILARVAVIL